MARQGKGQGMAMAGVHVFNRINTQTKQNALQDFFLDVIDWDWP